jgi:hypothetical protein
VVSENLPTGVIYVKCLRTLSSTPARRVTGTSTAHLRKTAVIEIFFGMVLRFAQPRSGDCNWGWQILA